MNKYIRDCKIGISTTIMYYTNLDEKIRLYIPLSELEKKIIG